MQKNMGIRTIKDFFVGILIGVISHIPGASGAIVAVIFGVYERLITDIANIRNKLFHDLKFVITIFIGFTIGIILCANCLDLFINNFKVPMMLFFAVLIVTQIPDIKKLASDKGPMTGVDVIAFTVGFMIMIVLLYSKLSSAHDTNADSGFLLMCLTGIIYAISKLVPGISGSTILLALGQFTVVNSALVHDVLKLLPMLLGIIIGVLTFARIIEYFLKTNKKTVYATVLGLTVGSAVIIIIEALMTLVETKTMEMAIQCIIGIILGIMFGMFLIKMAHCYQRSQNDGC